jgi:hypothetical protein
MLSGHAYDQRELDQGTLGPIQVIPSRACVRYRPSTYETHPLSLLPGFMVAEASYRFSFAGVGNEA